MTARVLVVDDIAANVKLLEARLTAEYFEVLTANSGQMAIDICARERVDVVLLDVMMPGMDGFEACRRIKSNAKTCHVPVIMVTALDQPSDKVQGLESGADDSVTKPFSSGELLARVRAVLRRAPRRAAEKLESGDLSLDLIRRRATLRGEELTLRHKEFNLLAELMRNQGVVLSRDLLMERVWGYDYSGDTSRTVDVHIRWLREKIEADPSDPRRIQTVRGIGYRFEG